MQRDPWFSRRWGFMGYGSTPLHYPLHPSIDRRVSVCTVALHRPRPRCHCIRDRRCTPGSLPGFMKEFTRLNLHASKYRIEQQNFRSSGYRVWKEEREREERGKKMDDPRGSVLRIFSRNIVGFKQRSDVGNSKCKNSRKKKGNRAIFGDFPRFCFRGKRKKKRERRFDVSVGRRCKKYRYKPKEPYF